MGRYEYAEADKGYRGDRQIASPDEYSTIAEKEMKFNVRARHETANKRLKDFMVLAGRFRHKINRNDMHRHKLCFNSVAVVTQLNITTTSPLYQIHGYNFRYQE